MTKNKILHWFIIGTFVSLYFAVSLISMIHVVSFFELSNPRWLAISLSVAFEIGAAASLCSIIILEKMNKTIVWALFWTLTLFQAMGNSYHSFVNLHDFFGWIELFGLTEEDPLFQKRILSIISGAILPLVALGFVKGLVDYLKPNNESKYEAQLKNEPLTPKEIDHSSNQTKSINNKEKEPVSIKKERIVEQKMYDSMSNDDRQKILDFIKQKIDVVDENLKKEENPQPEKSNLQPKIEVIKEEPKKVEPQPEIKVSTPSGVKGSKWAGRNRPKSNPV